LSIVHDTTPSFVKWRLQLADNSLEVILFYRVWILTLIHLRLDCDYRLQPNQTRVVLRVLPYSSLFKYLAKTEKSVPVGGALLPNMFYHTSQKAQLRAPLSPLQTAWTSFDPNLYSGGSSSAGTALVEIATARSLYSTGAL